MLEQKPMKCILSCSNMRFWVHVVWHKSAWGTLSGSNVKLLNITVLFRLNLKNQLCESLSTRRHVHAAVPHTQMQVYKWATPASGSRMTQSVQHLAPAVAHICRRIPLTAHVSHTHAPHSTCGANPSGGERSFPKAQIQTCPRCHYLIFPVIRRKSFRKTE